MNSVIVDCGAISAVHADILDKLPTVTFYGACDIIKERAEKTGREFNCKVFYDYDEVIKDENVQTVHICTPHYLHCEMTLKALKCGKNVVLEKPAAINREEFKEICDAQKMSDGKVCVIVQSRENPCVKKLMEIVKKNNEEKLLGIFANLRWNRDASYYAKDEWRGKWKTEGGGLMINQAIHLLDLMCLFGGEIEKIIPRISNRGIPEIEVEDTADAIIYFKNNARGVFTATNLYSRNMSFMLELNYENVTYRYSDGILMKITKENVEIIERDAVKSVIGKSYWGTGHRAAVKKFYDALSIGGKDYTNLSDIAITMDALFSFYDNK